LAAQHPNTVSEFLKKSDTDADNTTKWEQPCFQESIL